MTRTPITATAVLVALVATLAACSSASEPTATAPSTSTPAATTTAPAVPATPEPCVPAAVGATVETMAEIACAEEAGLVAYRLDEGAVIIDPAAEELPEAAVAAIVAPVREKIAEGAASSTPVVLAAMSAAQYASTQVQRNVVLVIPVETGNGRMFGAMDGDGDPELGHATLSATEAAAVAATEQWVASQADADRYLVVTVN